MARTKIKSPQLNPTSGGSADANGWVKKDLGSFQIYERSISFTSVVVAANSNNNIGTYSLPVGVTDTSTCRFYLGTLAGFGGRIIANLDNGNTTAAVSTFAVHLGNLTTGSITATGYLYIMIMTV